MNSHGVDSLSPVWERVPLLWPGKLGISSGHGRGKSYETFKGEFNPVKMVGPRHWLLHGSLYPPPLWDTVRR